MVEATTENPRYKGVVVNALKAQATVVHKPFGLARPRGWAWICDHAATRVHCVR